jgi:hypothetical protein
VVSVLKDEVKFALTKQSEAFYLLKGKINRESIDGSWELWRESDGYTQGTFKMIIE